MSSDLRLHAIIPAGGAGTRLWPLSRRSRPKFLLDLTGAGRTLLQGTVDRLDAVADSVTVVTGVAHVAAVAAQLPHLPVGNLVAEPSPRDSMAAIGLAAALVAHRHGEDAVVGSFAADQVVTDVPAFHDAVCQAIVLAHRDWVVTIGIEATGPSTAFGYIHAGELLAVPGAPSGRRVMGFTEKPDAATAAAYLATGDYRWNAGMFVARAGVLLGHLAAQKPELAVGVRAIAAAWDTDAREEVLARTWPGLEKIAIDHAIAEPVAAAGGVATVPASMGWDDVGGFDALAALLPPATDGPAAGAAVLDLTAAWRCVPGGDDAVAGPGPTGAGRAGGTGSTVADDAAALAPLEAPAGTGSGPEGADVEAIDSPGALATVASGRKVTLLGVPGIVVVDTPDALLVTTPQRSQEVKGVVDRLRAEGREDLL